jgi:hypothetical protein
MGWRSLDYSDATRMRSATRKLNVRFVGACRSSNVFCRPAPPVKYPRYDSDLLKVGSLLVGMPEPETLDPAAAASQPEARLPYSAGYKPRPLCF